MSENLKHDGLFKDLMNDQKQLWILQMIFYQMKLKTY
ncbi:putative transposase [Orientia tsutsugamushi str. TA716]|uniref:Putative transposase n=1 Tax=Orientia tsutsugamushi str. TA716 TaxID=1359175 RepID=A0A0F3P138_ORITS|nr:putative transposase [Orientia tsutsugamushi str. TA716]